MLRQLGLASAVAGPSATTAMSTQQPAGRGSGARDAHRAVRRREHAQQLPRRDVDQRRGKRHQPDMEDELGQRDRERRDREQSGRPRQATAA